MTDTLSLSQQRRAYEAVLAAMASPSSLWREYVLKGGLALQYACDSPRRFGDLDFSALRLFTNRLFKEKDERLLTFLSWLADGLEQTAPQYGFASLHVARKRLSDEIPVLQAQTDCVEAEGDAAPLPSPEEAEAYDYSPQEQAVVYKNRTMQVVGTPEAVRAEFESSADETGADEVMVTSLVHDHEARLHSYKLLAEVFEMTEPERAVAA